jgi:hypothetical protein
MEEDKVPDRDSHVRVLAVRWDAESDIDLKTNREVRGSAPTR